MVNGTDANITMQSKECGACGGEHSRAEECPVKGRQCNRCTKFNHFAKVWRTPTTQQRQTKHKTKKVHAISDSGEQQTDELYNDTMTKEHANTDKEQAFAELSSWEKEAQIKI